MKKLVFLTGFVILHGIFALTYSQTYFNGRYDLNNDNGWNLSTNILEINSIYILQIEGQIPGNPYHRRIAFQKLDLLGNPIGNTIIFLDTANSIGTGYGGSFIKLQNSSGYALVGFKSKYVPTGRYDRGLLMMFDNNLDTLWTRIYTDQSPHDSSFMFKNFRELYNGFIIADVYGSIDGNAFWRIRLLRIDTLGNQIWSHFYGNGNTDFVSFDVSNTSDSGYIIGGGFYPYNTNPQDSDPIIIKTDSMGNQKWLKHLGNSNCGEESAFVDLAKDGNIQVGTTYSDSCTAPGFDNYWDRINLLKIRNDGSVVWDIKYGLSKEWLKLYKVKVLEDGDILAVGKYQFISPEKWLQIGWMLKTDSAGNEQWYREYKLMAGDLSENVLYNVIPISDNGFAACGYVFPANPPDTGTQDSWVLKVDSIGCTAPGECWVGQEEIWVKTFTPDKPFIVYPNPAMDKLTVEFHINTAGAEIELFNVYGQSCKKIIHPPNKELAEMDVGNLPPGIYFLKVLAGTKVIGVEKVVVE